MPGNEGSRILCMRESLKRAVAIKSWADGLSATNCMTGDGLFRILSVRNGLVSVVRLVVHGTGVVLRAPHGREDVAGQRRDVARGSVGEPEARKLEVGAERVLLVDHIVIVGALDGSFSHGRRDDHVPGHLVVVKVSDHLEVVTVVGLPDESCKERNALPASV